jgi:hypothetical protein
VLVWLHVTIPVEDTIEHNVRLLHYRVHGDVEDVVTRRAATIDQYLRAVDGEVGSLGRTHDRNTLHNINSLDGDVASFTTYSNCLGRIDDSEAANPAVNCAIYLQAIERFVGERHFASWRYQPEVLNSNVHDLTPVLDLQCRSAFRAEIFGVV